MDDLFMMLLFLAAVILVFSWIRQRSMMGTQQSSADTSTKPQTVNKNQMAEDIKATKTSRVVDAVSILDDLTSTSSNYRHYCELVGTSMASGGVVAPYSRRQVAYYDIKCYRLDATYGGGQTETLVAHEHSIDPFFFTDASCDTPVYVDLESFGNNVILVNSTNHVEGPNSEFAQALKKSVGNATSGGMSGAYAMVAHVAERGSNAICSVVGALQGMASMPMQGVAPQHATAQTRCRQGAAGAVGGSFTRIRNRCCERVNDLLGTASTALQAAASCMTLQPAYAPAGSGGSSQQLNNRVAPHVKLFGRGGGPNAPSAQGGSRPQPKSHKPSSQPQINIHVGYGNRPPQHLGDFMGPYGGGPWVMGGGPGYGRPRHDDDAAILLGMGLGALLNTMTAAQQQSMQGYTTSTDTFRGYRLVENIVPLGSPIYCIGEIYRAGTGVYMSRSLAKDYPTSYFATKPESEVLSVIES